jgi:hypothetical protein
MTRAFILLAAFACLQAWTASAQTTGCEPVTQRAGRELGCFITAREDLGPLPRDSALYWHIDAFATEAAAKAARASRREWRPGIHWKASNASRLQKASSCSGLEVQG